MDPAKDGDSIPRPSSITPPQPNSPKIIADAGIGKLAQEDSPTSKSDSKGDNSPPSLGSSVSTLTPPPRASTIFANGKEISQPGSPVSGTSTNMDSEKEFASAAGSARVMLTAVVVREEVSGQSSRATLESFPVPGRTKAPGTLSSEGWDSGVDTVNGRLYEDEKSSNNLMIVEKLVKLPVVECTTHLYNVFKHWGVTGWAVQLTESATKIAATPASIVAAYLEYYCDTPIRYLDTALCMCLDTVGTVFPCMTVYPTEMCAATTTCLTSCACCCPRATSAGVKTICPQLEFC